MPDDTSLLSGSTARLLATFRANNIICEVEDAELNIIRYKTVNQEWRLLKGMVSEKLPVFSKQACDDKWWSYRLFLKFNLPTPDTIKYTSVKHSKDFIAKYKPIVIKPRRGAHGHGVSMNVTSVKELASPVSSAKKVNTHVLLQEQIQGTDIRLLVLGNQIVSALERRPAKIVGDGEHTVYELIQLENKKPERGKLGIDTLVAISLQSVRQFLNKEQLSFIPKSGESVRVVGPSNQSIGGTVHDITDKIPASMRQDTLRLTEHLQMPIAGVDCIMTHGNYYFLEINASPGIAIHDDLDSGIQSGCFTSYMHLLYQDSWWRT